MTDNYNAAQVHADSVFRIIDNGKTPNPSELEAGKMYALLAVADELRSLRLLIEDVMGKAGGRGFVRVFDEAPR